MLSGAKRRTPIMGYCADQITELPIRPMSDIVSHYYLRFTVVDAPGVLAQISGILGKYDISIQSMIQPERHAADAVPIVIMTHDARESNIDRALAEIDQLEIIQQPTRLIRVENNLG
jgi:homoserine dehydrogenase